MCLRFEAGTLLPSSWLCLVLICCCIASCSAHDIRECGTSWDVNGGRICHLSRTSDHFCQTKVIRIRFQPAPDSVPKVIQISSCDAETGHAVVRALCKVSDGPTVEAREHVVWTVNGDPSDTETSSYLFIFEVSASELFAFAVDGEVLSCISDYHWGRGVVCFTLETPGGSVTLYRYAYSDRQRRWLESDIFTEFVKNRTLLTSPSFVLEHCSSSTPLVIVGTTQGVQSIQLSHDNPDVHQLTELQAVKLLRHNQCGVTLYNWLYILTLDGVQVYNVPQLQAKRLQPLNWSVAELSLDGRRIAFAGTYPNQSCWIQVWNTANQEVVLNVTMDECDIASTAVSKMYVCYHLTNITDREWKIACLVLEGNNEELVLLKNNRRSMKNRSLTLDGNILVERVWGASPYTMNFYHVPQKTTLHRYKSKYPTLAYRPGTLGAQNNRCGVNPPIRPTPTIQTPSTSPTTISESVSSAVEPTSTAGSIPAKSVVSQFPWIAILFCGIIVLIVLVCAVLLVVIIIMKCYKKPAGRQEYQTNESHPETLANIVNYFKRNWKVNHVDV